MVRKRFLSGAVAFAATCLMAVFVPSVVYANPGVIQGYSQPYLRFVNETRPAQHPYITDTQDAGWDIYSTQFEILDDLNDDGYPEYMVFQGGLYRVYQGDVRVSPRIVHFSFALNNVQSRVVVVDDRNGDGKKDFAISNPLGAGQAAQPVVLYSGVDGTQIGTIPAPAGVYDWGWTLALGIDSDSDGQRELLIGGKRANTPPAEPESMLSAFGTATSTLLWIKASTADYGLQYQPKVGNQVLTTTDRNSDGVQDLILSTVPDIESQYTNYLAPEYDAGLLLVSGADGGLIQRIQPTQSPIQGEIRHSFGRHIEYIGDYDSDGSDDIIVLSGAAGGPSGGMTYISGADFTEITTLVEFYSPEMDFLDDRTGDGVFEYSVGGSGYRFIGDGQGLYLYDAIGGVSFNGTAYFENAGGFRIASYVDLNQDGVTDYLLYGQRIMAIDGVTLEGIVLEGAAETVSEYRISLSPFIYDGVQYTQRIVNFGETGTLYFATEGGLIDISKDDTPVPASGTKNFALALAHTGGAHMTLITDLPEVDLLATLGAGSTVVYYEPDLYTANGWGTDYTPKSYPYLADTVPPIVFFLGQPAAQTNIPYSWFSFFGNEPSTMECAVDMEPWAPCAVAFATVVADGTHTFYVRATDTYGNTSIPLTHTWEVDTTPPETILISGPDPVVTTREVTFEFASDDPEAAFYCALNTQNEFAPCVSPWTISLDNGDYTMYIAAVDSFGNPDPTPVVASFTVEVPPASVQIVSGPALLTNLTDAIFVIESENVHTLKCVLDNNAEPLCGNNVALTDLADGQHIFSVNAYDASGVLVASTLPFEWWVDTAPPTVVLQSPTENATTGRVVEISFSSETNVQFYCSLDGSLPVSCTSPFVASLEDGAHHFAVSAIDLAGNQSGQTTLNWDVDGIGPELQIFYTPEPLTNIDFAEFSFYAQEPATYYCKLDNQSWEICSRYWYQQNTAEGLHQFSVYAVDLLGNPGPVFRFDWTVDLTPPQILFSTYIASPSNVEDQTISFSVTDGLVVRCDINGSLVDPCVSPVQIKIGGSSQKFSVFAEDQVGNGISESLSWLYDDIPPVTAILSSFGQLNSQQFLDIDLIKEKGATTYCRLDSGTWKRCADANDTAFSVRYWGRDGINVKGEHTFDAYSIDQAGNIEIEKSISWTYGYEGPTAVILTGPGDLDDLVADFSFKTADARHITCTLENENGGIVLGRKNNCASPVSFSLPSPTRGNYPQGFRFRIHVEDGEGGIDGALTTFTHDVVNPTITGLWPLGGAGYPDAPDSYLIGKNARQSFDEGFITVRMQSNDTGTQWYCAFDDLPAEYCGEGAKNDVPFDAGSSRNTRFTAIAKDSVGRVWHQKTIEMEFDFDAPGIKVIDQPRIRPGQGQGGPPDTLDGPYSFETDADAIISCRVYEIIGNTRHTAQIENCGTDFYLSDVFLDTKFVWGPNGDRIYTGIEDDRDFILFVSATDKAGNRSRSVKIQNNVHEALPHVGYTLNSVDYENLTADVTIRIGDVEGISDAWIKVNNVWSQQLDPGITSLTIPLKKQLTMFTNKIVIQAESTSHFTRKTKEFEIVIPGVVASKAVIAKAVNVLDGFRGHMSANQFNYKSGLASQTVGSYTSSKPELLSTSIARAKNVSGVQGAVANYEFAAEYSAIVGPGVAEESLYQWHHGDGIGGIRLRQAWRKFENNRPIRVAIIDTGFDRNHPGLNHESVSSKNKFVRYGDMNDIWTESVADRHVYDIGGDGSQTRPGRFGIDDDGDGKADFEDLEVLSRKDNTKNGTNLNLVRYYAADDDEDGYVDDAGWDFVSSAWWSRGLSIAPVDDTFVSSFSNHANEYGDDNNPFLSEDEKCKAAFGEADPSGSTVRPTDQEEMYCKHGTLVAGLLAANNLSQVSGELEGFSGIQPYVKIIPIRAFHENPNTKYSTEYIVSVFKFTLAQRPDIILMGGNFSLSHSSNPIQAIKDNLVDTKGLDLLKNTLIVTPAGNKSQNLDNCGDECVGFPRDLDSDNVVVVGGSNSLGGVWNRSNIGDVVDVFAPAENIVATSRGSDDSLYTTVSGTSFAAATVAGLAAMYMATYPQYSEAPKIVAERIARATTYKVAPTQKGLIDAEYLMDVSRLPPVRFSFVEKSVESFVSSSARNQTDKVAKLAVCDSPDERDSVFVLVRNDSSKQAWADTEDYIDRAIDSRIEMLETYINVWTTNGFDALVKPNYSEEDWGRFYTYIFNRQDSLLYWLRKGEDQYQSNLLQYFQEPLTVLNWDKENNKFVRLPVQGDLYAYSGVPEVRHSSNVLSGFFTGGDCRLATAESNDPAAESKYETRIVVSAAKPRFVTELWRDNNFLSPMNPNSSVFFLRNDVDAVRPIYIRNPNKVRAATHLGSVNDVVFINDTDVLVGRNFYHANYFASNKDIYDQDGNRNLFTGTYNPGGRGVVYLWRDVYEVRRNLINSIVQLIYSPATPDNDPSYTRGLLDWILERSFSSGSQMLAWGYGKNSDDPSELETWYKLNGDGNPNSDIDKDKRPLAILKYLNPSDSSGVAFDILPVSTNGQDIYANTRRLHVFDVDLDGDKDVFAENDHWLDWEYRGLDISPGIFLENQGVGQDIESWGILDTGLPGIFSAFSRAAHLSDLNNDGLGDLLTSHASVQNKAGNYTIPTSYFGDGDGQIGGYTSNADTPGMYSAEIALNNPDSFVSVVETGGGRYGQHEFIFVGSGLDYTVAQINDRNFSEEHDFNGTVAQISPYTRASSLFRPYNGIKEPDRLFRNISYNPRNPIYVESTSQYGPQIDNIDDITTGAKFTDLNGDGYEDLVVTYRDSPMRVFIRSEQAVPVDDPVPAPPLPAYDIWSDSCSVAGVPTNSKYAFEVPVCGGGVR